MPTDPKRPGEVGGEIAKPEWLDSGLESARSVFNLALHGKLPPNIKGWMLQTACLRVLRAIHGSDLGTVSNLRAHVLEQEQRMMEVAHEIETKGVAAVLREVAGE